MKRKRLSKRLITLIMSAVLMLSITMPASAMTSVFGTAGSGSNPFTPRGYSIVEGGTQYWLDSNYMHNYKRPSDNVHSAVWSDSTNPANPLTKIYYVASGDKKMYAWVDKGQLTSGYNLPYQRGFTTDSGVDVRNFFLVSINDGPFVTVPYAEAAAKNLKDSNGDIDATQGLSAFGYANRSVIDPDGCTNDWVYPLTFTLKPGTKYTFTFARGFAANNGMSLILSPDKTADGQSGYTGVLQGPTLTDAERAEWTAHKSDIYQYVYGLTPLGTGVNTAKTVYSVEFKDFYHTLQTYADLTALNSILTEASTFANNVTDNDYKLGNYRKSSVEALKTLIDQINAKTDLKEELQTSVDALTKQVSDALDYAKEPAILVKGITLNNNRADIYVGDTLTLKATVSPENADDPTVTWTSSNSKIATVENGVVTAVSAGDATITAKTADGGYTATCAIAVKQQVSTINAADNNGSVTGLDGTTLPSGTSFIVSQINQSENTSKYDTASKSIALSSATQGKELLGLYEFTLKNGNTTIEPDGYVQVRIPIPENLRGRTGLDIVRINSDNSIALMHAASDGTYLTFKTNHFSVYGIIADIKSGSTKILNPNTGDTNSKFLLFILMGVAAILITLIAAICSIPIRMLNRRIK